MPADADRTASLKMAHVLFLDLVGYSRRPLVDQQRLVEELNETVRRCPECDRAEGRGELAEALGRPAGSPLP